MALGVLEIKVNFSGSCYIIQRNPLKINKKQNRRMVIQ